MSGNEQKIANTWRVLTDWKNQKGSSYTWSFWAGCDLVKMWFKIWDDCLWILWSVLQCIWIAFAVGLQLWSQMCRQWLRMRDLRWISTQNSKETEFLVFCKIWLESEWRKGSHKARCSSLVGWEVGLVPPAKAEAIGDCNGRSVSAQYLVCFFRKCPNGFLSFPWRFCRAYFWKAKRFNLPLP